MTARAFDDATLAPGGLSALIPGPQAAARTLRARPLAAFGLAFILLLVTLALAPGLFAPHAPDAQDPVNALDGASRTHPFGTDNFGRDLLSRVIYGARTTLVVGFGAVAVSIALATVVGGVSAYAGGWIDASVQRVVDALMALPWLLILMSMMALLGSGRTNTALVIGVLAAPSASRVIRASVLQLRSRPWVEAARATGATDARVLVRHLLPNIVPDLIVLTSVGIGSAILAEAALSFLGFGITPPEPAWGYMLGIEGRRFFNTAPWLAIYPGLAITLTVFSFNVVGDAIRDLTDPRLRR